MYMGADEVGMSVAMPSRVSLFCESSLESFHMKNVSKSRQT